MKTKTIYFLLFFVLKINAQNTKQNFSFKNKITYDTLYVYDTLRVTDTLRLPVKVAALPALEKCELSYVLLTIPTQENEKFLILNENFAATFSTKRILLSENKNNSFTIKTSDKMKKIGFFGVVFFAFQHLVVAQNRFSMSLSSGFYNQKANEIVTIDYKLKTGNTTTKAAPFVKLGTHLFFPVWGNRLKFETGVNYYYMKRSDFQIFTPDPNFKITYNGGEDFSKNVQMFTFPAILQVKLGRIRPILGAEYFYKRKPMTAFVANGTAREQIFYKLPSYGIFFIAGVETKISKHLNIRLTYNRAVSDERQDQPFGNQYKTKMMRAELGLLYQFVED